MLLYRILGIFLLPIITLYMLVRLFQKKESITSVLHKFTILQNKVSNKKVIWFHAASVGEVNIVIPLVKKIMNERSDLHCLVTTVTQTSAKVFKSNKIKNTTHQFLPLDIVFIVNNFLKHWSPRVIIFIESELWPNIIHQAAKNTPILLFNGRLSDASYRKWKRYKRFISKLLKKFALILPSSKLDYERFADFTKDNLKFIGNFKYSAPTLNYSKQYVDLLKEQLKNRSVFVAASTHNGEERILFEVYKKLKKQISGLFTIIIPRHPHRADKIKAEAQRYQLNCVENINDFEENSDILLVSEFGVLGNFFHFTEIVFIGGSLINIGGHNILEPAKLGTAIIIGPYFSNFREIVEEFDQKNAICIVKKVEDFEKKLLNLFQDLEYKKELISNAKNISSKHANITQITIESIYKIIGLNISSQPF